MKTSIPSMFVAMVFLVISSSCAAPATPAPPTVTPVPPTLPPVPTVTPLPTATATAIVYSASVHVVDENGNSLSSAKIIQGENVDLTDSQGVWSTSGQSPDLSLRVWAQGYLLQDYSASLQAGDNEIQVALAPDPFGLKAPDLEKEGYELVFVEDFQDGIVDCRIKGNGNVTEDDTDPENQLLLVDLRNLDEGFSCFFGPINLQDAIIEVDFRYPEILYGDSIHEQGYYVEFRDYFNVVGDTSKDPFLMAVDFTSGERIVKMSVPQEIHEMRWYRLSTRYDGIKVEVRMDGYLRFTFLKPPTMINSGPSHFGAYSQAYIQFDNIKMWIPID